MAVAMQARRFPWRLGAIAVVAVVGLLGLGRLADILPSFSNPFATDEVDRTGPVVLQELRDLSEYRAATGDFSVLVDLEDDARFLPDFIQGERVLFSAVGTVDASVDFSGLDDGAVQVAEDGAVTVTVPHARLGDAAVDPERSEVLDRDRGVLDRVGSAFTDNPTSERELYVLAEERLAVAAREAGVVERAEENTEAMLRGLLGALGHDDVRVVFEDRPT